jgi:gluconate 2-dehydrogenase gamma chain
MVKRPKDSNGHSRRQLFKLAGLASVLGTSSISQAQGAPTSPQNLEALETLTASEANILEAFCARLIPSDANGPGAKEARAAHYIDRALGGALASGRTFC